MGESNYTIGSLTRRVSHRVGVSNCWTGIWDGTVSIHSCSKFVYNWLCLIDFELPRIYISRGVVSPQKLCEQVQHAHMLQYPTMVQYLAHHQMLSKFETLTQKARVQLLDTIAIKCLCGQLLFDHWSMHLDLWSLLGLHNHSSSL